MSATPIAPRAPDLCGCALDGRYELHEAIGEGAFGRVYRGYDRRLARDVAVKVIKPWWSEDPAWVRRFEREAQLLASQNDPAIVHIYDVGSAPEGLYYVTELVRGESLGELLRRGPLPSAQAVEIAIGICRALARAHAGGLVHRDVKPQNVLLQGGSRSRTAVKVTDFGIARTVQDGDVETATAAGTPAYMAPEQARGGPVSPATDVYGAGIVLYEMLAGRPPFSGRSPVELALHHLGDPPPPLPETVPPWLAAIVAQALAKDPDDRFADCGELARGLDAERRPASASGAPRSGQASRGTLVGQPFSPRLTFNPAERRQRMALFALVALLALALLGGGLALAPGSRGTSWLPDLDAAPAPVIVPALGGDSSAAAAATLRSETLRPRFAQVPAPGASPGTVVSQAPKARSTLAGGATVLLSVAEVPRWRAVATESGSRAVRSIVFRIHGESWRLSYAMSYQGTCTWIFFCSGPHAEVAALAGGRRLDDFDLGSGSGELRQIHAGPGLYRLTVSPGSDQARWRMTVEDHF